MYLERVSGILEIAGPAEGATVAEICAATKLPKPTAYRIVQDLVAVGLLDPTGRGRFAVGARLKRIASDDRSDRALLAVAAPILKKAADTHGSAFFLSRLRGTSVEIIGVETPDTGVAYLHPGLGKRPLHACSCSKAVAAFSPDLFALNEIEGRLRDYTEFTLTDARALQAEFASIRTLGYAQCVEELERGSCSVAAPLAQSGPGATMSIGATGSTRVFTPAYRVALGSTIIAIARDIADHFAWQGDEVADAAG